MLVSSTVFPAIVEDTSGEAAKIMKFMILIMNSYITFTNLFLPTDSLFLAILLVKQYIKLEWPNCCDTGNGADIEQIIVKVAISAC